ncbi:MAG: hypothetical protein ACYTGQ_16915 [Planctomycetota bacterium]|jgi:hypothetical protein
MSRRIKTHVERTISGQAALAMWVSFANADSLDGGYRPTENGRT